MFRIYFTSQDTEKLEDKVKKFTDLAHKLCHKTMTEDENIISRIMGNYKCEKASFSEEIEKQAIRLYVEGNSKREVGRILGISKNI